MSLTIGYENYNNFGSKMIIINDKGWDNVEVYFPEYNWIYKKTTRQHFLKGVIKCPYEKRYYNIGYLGEGKYKASENNKSTKCYNTWNNMLKRCYDEKVHKKYPTYIGCSVCEEWHNFQNFAKWYEENYYEVEGEVMCLDKDILCKNNKIYSPSTCIFVPKSINSLFVKSDSSRGSLPIGVQWDKKHNKYRIQTHINKKLTTVKRVDTIEEAFDIYKKIKEDEIKYVADDYYSKGLIPKKLYDAMCNYKININD